MRQAPSGTLQPPFEFGIQKLPRGLPSIEKTNGWQRLWQGLWLSSTAPPLGRVHQLINS
jgi:hypothetical protein